MCYVRWTSIAASLLLLAACSRGVRATKPRPPPSLAPAASPTASFLPPVITPTPGASVAAATAPPILKRAPRLPSDAAPKILAIAVSETIVHPGDRVSGSVLTSSNVASVQARIGGYAMNLSKVGVGRFALAYKVAPLPWFIRGTFTLSVIARNPRGDTTTRAFPLMVR